MVRQWVQINPHDFYSEDTSAHTALFKLLSFLEKEDKVDNVPIVKLEIQESFERLNFIVNLPSKPLMEVNDLPLFFPSRTPFLMYSLLHFRKPKSQYCPSR